MYSESAAYGHMGRNNETVTKTFRSADGKTELNLEVELFTWEKLDFMNVFKNAFNC
jgi:S-adenosylmethionine synthetase